MWHITTRVWIKPRMIALGLFIAGQLCLIGAAVLWMQPVDDPRVPGLQRALAEQQERFAAQNDMVLHLRAYVRSLQPPAR